MITKEQRAEMRSTNAARRIPCDEGYEIGGAEDDLDKALDALDEMERHGEVVSASWREKVRQAKIKGVKEGIRLALEQMEGDADVEIARANVKLLQGDEEGIAAAIMWP